MRRKAIVFAEFPAPYRIKVFEELAKEYDLTFFFNQNIDQERNIDYIVKSSTIKYIVLDKKDNIQKFSKCLRNIKEYDFVLDYNIGLYNGVRFMLYAILNNIPCFINNDGAFINRNFFKNQIKKFLIKRAALCFGSGESSKRYFLTYGAKEENIRYHHFTSLNDEDILEKPLSKCEKLCIKRQLELGEQKIVMSVGQFIYRKGFDVLLKAWENIEDNFHLLIIGEGSLEQSYYDYIQSRKLKNVKIIGFKAKRELFEYYKAADLFVLPTREDIWGLVVNEAMACGLPVIATDRCVAGMELIENGVNGYIVPVENPLALTDKINEILKDDQLALAMMENNIEKIHGYTMKNIGIKHIKDINEYFSNSKG